MGCSGSKSTATGNQSPKNKPKIVLHYFATRGRAEPIRLIMHYGGISFEDKRCTLEQYTEIKQKDQYLGPFGRLPYVEYNGEIVAQSIAIMRFAARATGVLGENSLETLCADSLSETFASAVADLSLIVFAKGDDTEEKLKAIYEAEVEPSMKTAEKAISEVNDGKTGYIVGKKITYADFVLFNYMETVEKAFKKEDKDVYADFPLLKGHRDLIKGLPQLKAYLDSRPDTPV